MINFKKFLKSEGVNTKAFWKQCKRKNQDWTAKAKKRSELKGTSPIWWVSSAFNWNSTTEGHEYWNDIDTKWKELIRNEIDTEFGFGKGK